MQRRCFVIVNPTSGSFSQSKINKILASLTKSGLDPVLMPTGSPLDPELFAARLCAEMPDPLILVAGGDGTVNGVLNGLAPGAATLGVIPLGTSNVLARELGIDGMEQALMHVARGRTRMAPVGEVSCAGEKRRFLLMAGIGTDGEVVQGVRLREKRTLGKVAYFLSALRVLNVWDRRDVQVTCGASSLSCHSLIVCNAAKYGGNFLLASRGDLFTPGFQVLCINGGPLTYLKLALLLVLGKVESSRSVTVLSADELEVSGEKAVQLDGDYFGRGALLLRSIPDFVRLIV